MYVLKGFAPHADLAINTPGVVNKIGELSTNAMTYSLEKGVYTEPVIAPRIAMITFMNEEDGVEKPVSNANRDIVLKAIFYVYNKTFSNPGVQIDSLELANELLSTQTDIKNVKVGTMVDANPYYVPQYIQFELRAVADSLVKIWFADEAFRSQYDEFDIKVVLPFEPIDDFFKSGAVVEALLKTVTKPVMAARMQAAKGQNPETILRIDEFDYHDPNSTTRRVPSPFGTLIYGIAGNNLDAVKEAIVNEILSKSTHTRDEWAKILPDLFRRTEIVFIPFWGRVAIPNRQYGYGIYSPVVGITEADTIMKRLVTPAVGYQPSHINANATVTGHHWRSLQIGSIGHIENKDGKVRLDQIFPDFISVPSTSVDWNRMSTETKNFAYMLTEMLIAAEQFTEFGLIPEGMMKVKRDGKLFLSQSYLGVNYLVLAKVSY